MTETVDVWISDGKWFEIKRNTAPTVRGPDYHIEERTWYCGYCTFERRPVREDGYGGILTYVPVHGGITFSHEDVDGKMTYGFDCAHVDDELRPELMDAAWLRAESEKMARCIEIAAKHEEAYLLARTREKKAEVLGVFENEVGGIPVGDNFGAMIKILSGAL